MTDTVEATKDYELRIEDLLRVFWKGKWFLVIALVLGTITGLALDRFIPKSYTSNVRWLVSPSSNMNSMMGLASLVGMSTGGSMSSTQNPAEQYYEDLILSPLFLDSLTLLKWPTVKGDSVTLCELLKIDTSEWNARPAPFDKISLLRRVIIANLSGKVIKFERTASAFSLEIELTDPVSAAAVGKHILERLRAFNEKMKQGDAQRELLFIEEQMKRFERELKIAEGALESYLFNNQFRESAAQKMQEARLNREVSLKSALATEFRKQFEMARISESKELTPFIVIEEPTPPIRPSSPSKMVYLIIAVFLFEVFAVLFIFIMDWYRQHGSIFFKSIRTK